MTAGPTSRLLRAQLRWRRGALARLGGWSVLEAAPAALTGVLVARAVDRGFLAGRPLLGLGWLGLVLLATAVAAVARWACSRSLGELVEPVRDAFVTAVVSSTLTAAVQRDDAPDTVAVARLAGQVQQLRGLLSVLLRAARQTAVTLVAVPVGLLALSPLAAAIVAGPVLLACVAFALALPGLTARFDAVLATEEDVARVAEVRFRGVRDVVACRAEDRAGAEIAAAVEANAAAVRAEAVATTVRQLVVFLGGPVPLVGLLAAAPWLLGSGRLTAGAVAGAAVCLTAGLIPAVNGLVGTVGTWGPQFAVTLRRLDRSTGTPDLPVEVGAPDRTRAPAPALVAGDLSFAYGEAADPVLDGLDLAVAPGERLAVVGASGIGKSTLADLLAGLRTGRRGEVLVGGLPLRGVPEPRRTRAVMLVPQESYVLAGTLRENLTYLAPDARTATVLAAVAAVGLDGVVRAAGGLDGPVGAQLSAGERQLVALGRAYLAPAGLLILDEATCYLDLAAEARVERAFAARGATTIVIAHRIASARRADRILLLDGAGAELGTHDELLARSAAYARLVAPQPVAPRRPHSW